LTLPPAPLNFVCSWMEYIAEWSGNSERKAVPGRALKACRGNRDMAPVIVNDAIDGGQRSPSRAGDFTFG